MKKQSNCPDCGGEMVESYLGGVVLWPLEASFLLRRQRLVTARVCVDCGFVRINVKDPSAFRPKNKKHTLPKSAGAKQIDKTELPRATSK